MFRLLLESIQYFCRLDAFEMFFGTLHSPLLSIQPSRVVIEPLAIVFLLWLPLELARIPIDLIPAAVDLHFRIVEKLPHDEVVWIDVVSTLCLQKWMTIGFPGSRW